MSKPLLVLLIGSGVLLAVTPTITSFTPSATTVANGGTVTLTWVVANVPTSITITPGQAGTGTYVDSTNPASGNAVFTVPATARVRFDGDSLTCGFRTTNAAVHTTDVGLPCNPNPNDNGSPCCAFPPLTILGSANAGFLVKTWSNLGVVGKLVSGATAPTCAASGFIPDILVVDYGANDLASGGTSVATFETNIQAYWHQAKLNGCIVIAATVTPRTNISNDVTIRQAANTYIRANYATDAVALMDFGGDASMGCATCNLVGHVLPDSSVSLYYNQLDCTPTCPDGTALTHWSDSGHAYLATNYAIPALEIALASIYTITGTNASGTSAASYAAGGVGLITANPSSSKRSGTAARSGGGIGR